METLTIMYVVFGLLLVLLAIPLWLEKIPPNGAYGFRVKKTLENEKIWYAVNRYMAPWLAGMGMATVISAILLRLIPDITLDVYSLVILAILLVIFGMGIFVTVRFMNRLK